MSEKPEGRVAVGVALKVSPDEMRGWRPETISLFFGGIAMAIKARDDGRRDARIVSEIERDTGKEPG